MTCPDYTQWELVAMDALSDDERETLESHTSSCPTCREHLERARREHLTLLRAYEAFEDGLDQRCASFEAALEHATPPAARRRSWRLGDYRMSLTARRMRTTALIALPAACVAVALILVLGATPKIAFAKVAQAIRQSRTMMCTVTEISDEDSPLAATPWTGALAMEYDGQWWKWRVDVDDNDIAFVSDGRRLYRVVASTNTAHSFTKYADVTGSSSHRIPNGKFISFSYGDGVLCTVPADLDGFLAGLERVTENDCVAVDPIVFDGRTIPGFEIAGAKLGFGDALRWRGTTVRLWIDPRTALPAQVQIVSSSVAADPDNKCGMVTKTTTWTDIHWDAAINREALNPAIADYMTPRDPTPEEEDALVAAFEHYAAVSAAIGAKVEELGDRCASLTDPRQEKVLSRLTAPFPEKLEPALWGIFRTSVVETVFKYHCGVSDVEDILEPLPAPIRTVLSNAEQTWLDGKDIAYYGGGEDITPGDPEAVLLEWTLDDGRQRVLFADLHYETR